MQSLLLERACGALRPGDFATTVMESLYTSLRPAEPPVFPENCHRNAAVNSLSIDAVDHQYMLSGCADSSVKIWDLHKNSGGGPGAPLAPLVSVPKKTAHQYGVSAVKWWPMDTGMFISASFDHSVNVWDTNAVEVVHGFDLGSRVYAIAISAHRTNEYSAQALIAAASDQPCVRLLDLRAASSAHTLPGHKGKTLAVAWHPRNSYLLASGGHDGEAKVWDIRSSSACVARLDMTKTNVRSAAADSLNLGSSAVSAHSGPVNALVWDEAGHVLYTAGNDDKIRVWDMVSSNAPPINRLVNFGPLTRNKYLQTLPLVLSPKTETEVQHLLFASDNGDVLVFRAMDGKLVSRLQRTGSKIATRTASIVYAEPYSATYFCGTMDGEIVAWRGGRARGPMQALGHSSGPVPAEKEEPVNANDLYDDPYFKYQLA